VASELRPPSRAGWVEPRALPSTHRYDVLVQPCLSFRPPVRPPAVDELSACLDAVADSTREALLTRSMSPPAHRGGLCSAAVFTHDGRLLAPGRAPQPLLAGGLPLAVQGIVGEFTEADMEAGDGYICNDPWRGGSQLPELVLLRPVVAQGAVQAMVACALHHEDLGGMSPASPPVAASSVYEEGLRIPPVRLHHRDQADTGLFSLLCANSRVPDALAADLRMQWSVLLAAEQAVQLLLDEPGGFRAQCEAALARSEAKVRAVLREVPDGDYRFAAARGDAGAVVRVPVLLRKERDRLVIDLTDCAAQSAGPGNAARGAVWSAVADFARSLAPGAAANAGCTAPLQVRSAPGTIVDPAFPAAVGGGGPVVELLWEALHGAWAQARRAGVAA